MEEMEGADGQVLSHLGTHRWLALHTACFLDDVTIVTSSATSRTRGHVTRTYLESRGFAKGVSGRREGGHGRTPSGRRGPRLGHARHSGAASTHSMSIELRAARGVRLPSAPGRLGNAHDSHGRRRQAGCGPARRCHVDLRKNPPRVKWGGAGCEKCYISRYALRGRRQARDQSFPGKSRAVNGRVPTLSDYRVYARLP